MTTATTNQPAAKSTATQVLRPVSGVNQDVVEFNHIVPALQKARYSDLYRGGWLTAEQEAERKAERELLIVTAMRELKAMCVSLGLDPDTISAMADKEDMKVTEQWHTDEIKVWFPAEDRRYGFTKGSVHFHWNRGCCFECDGSDFPVVSISGRPPREPKKGERIVYVKFETPRGMASSQWGLEEDWLKAMKECDHRAEYRLMRLDVRHWQGKNLGHMRLMYPKEFSFAQHGYVCQKLVNIEKTLAGQQVTVEDWVDVPDPR